MLDRSKKVSAVFLCKFHRITQFLCLSFLLSDTQYINSLLCRPFYIVLLSSSYLSSSWLGKVSKGLWWKAYTMQVNDFVYSAGNLIYGIIAIYHTTSPIDYATAHSCKCLYNHHKLMFDMIWDISLTFFEIPGWSYSEI